MTITATRKHEDDTQDFLVECDHKGCKRHLEFREKTWRQMADAAQHAAGWQFKKVLSSWHHYCEGHHK